MRTPPVRFSVIMPCYNSAAFVAEAVQSLIRQTYPNWELIAVNDGSTDDTLEILTRFAAADGRIKVFSKENGGYVSAVNLGLEKISGDYFLFLGSDDALTETLFFEIVDGMPEDEKLPDMIAFRALKFKDGTFFERDALSNFDSVARLTDVSAAEFEAKYPKQARILFVRDTAKCFKTEKLGGLRYFGKSGYDADGAFSCLFSQNCRSFLSLAIDGYRWTIREDSVSAKVNQTINIDRLRVWIKYLTAVNQKKSLTLSKAEKGYVLSPFFLCPEILSRRKRGSVSELLLSHKALRLSLKVAKKNGAELSHFRDILDKNPIKRSIYLAFPCLFLKRHGYIAFAKSQQTKEDPHH